MKIKNEMKKFWNHFDRWIAVDWMHGHGATVSGAVKTILFKAAYGVADN